MDKPKNCFCSKKAIFYSERFKKSFCSDECLENFQLKDNPPEAPIVVIGRKGAYFKQGDVMFPVYKDIARTLAAATFGGENSCLDTLMDSQVITLARENGLPVDPFVRSLVRSPLHGIIQLAHYAAMNKEYDKEYLLENQRKRVAEYIRKLAEWKPEGSPNGHRAPSQKTVLLSHTFRVTAKAAGVSRGRASQVLDVLKGLGGSATLAQLIDSAKGKVKTKQDTAKIVTRFTKELIESGAIEEVK